MAAPKLRFRDEQGQEFPEWKKTRLGNLVCEDLIPVPTPTSEYIRLGLHNFNKGTFYEKVPAGKGLSVDTMYMVKKYHLIVNITFAWEGSITVTSAEDEGKLVSHRFPQYKFKENNNPIFFRYMMSMKRFRFELGLASPGGAGRNRVLNKKQFMKIPVNIPSLPEQQKIADFLTTVDRQIDIQSQRVEAMKNRKKGLLQKIFSQEIRFKDEQGREYPEWLRATFGNLFLALRKNALSRDTLNYEHGNIKNIHYGDILVGFGATVQSTSPLVPYINADKIPKSYDILQCGDIIIADTAEDETAGKGIEIINDSIPTISGLHTLPYRPQTKFAPGYLGYFLNSPYYHKQLIPLLHGIKVLSVTKAELEKTIISYPTLPEQQKIASFFTAVDKQIEVEEKRLETMKNIKKGLLQQMFI